MGEYYYNNKSYNEKELKAEFPNVAINFTSLLDEVVPVLSTPKPAPITNLRRVIRNGVELDGLGNTVEAWAEVDMFTSDLLDIDGVTVLKTIVEQETEYVAALLQKAYDSKLTELSVKSTEVEEGGIAVADLGGLEIATDQKAQAKLTAGVTYFGRNPTQTRRFEHKNGFGDATEATTIIMQDALAAHVESVTLSKEVHYIAIKALTTPEAVEAYDITIGW